MMQSEQDWCGDDGRNPSVFFFRDRARIAEFAFRRRIASMFVFREWVEAGGLLSYGPSITAQFVRVAELSAAAL
jgi:hypothetical protein